MLRQVFADNISAFTHSFAEISSYTVFVSGDQLKEVDVSDSAIFVHAYTVEPR